MLDIRKVCVVTENEEQYYSFALYCLKLSKEEDAVIEKFDKNYKFHILADERTFNKYDGELYFNCLESFETLECVRYNNYNIINFKDFENSIKD